MAVTKLGNSKSAGNSINYGASRAEVKSGVNCDPDIAKEQFKTTRNLWGKNNKVQAHTIIQSFAHGEVTPAQANEIGKQLAEKIASGHEVVIFTHADKKHVHNHIIINSVNFENGRKYHSNNQKLEDVRQINDELCTKNGLSIASDRSAPVRYTLAEQALLNKGKDSWKDEIRVAVDIQVRKSSSYEDFKSGLKQNFGIVVDDTRKYITFTHPEGKKSRGHKLGADYTKEGIQYGVERQIENRSPERSAEDSRGFKPRNDNGSDSFSGMERGVPKLPELNKQLRELTPAGIREAAAAQRAAEEAARLLERQQQTIGRTTNRRSYDNER